MESNLARGVKRQASAIAQMTKEEEGKCSWMLCVTWWHRIWRRPPSPQSLQSRQTFRNATRRAGWSKKRCTAVRKRKGWGMLKPSGHAEGTWEPRGATSTNAEGTGWCHCKTTLNNLWTVMVTGRNAQERKENKCHSNLPKGSKMRTHRTTGTSSAPQAQGKWWSN